MGGGGGSKVSKTFFCVQQMKPKGDLPLNEITSSDQENDRKDQLKMDKRVIVAVVISLAVVLILGLGIGLGVNWSKNNEENDGRICEYF